MALQHSDREVERFHPICYKSLQAALRMTGMATNYCVEHHKRTGELEMDFAITNKGTGRIACVIEVKRTPSAVKSSRYQYQAMSYLQQTPPALIERPYYILTNIECSCLFRYDASRPNVHQQMLAPGLTWNTSLADTDNDEELAGITASHFARLLETVFSDSGQYLGGIDAIVAMLTEAANMGEAEWNSRFARTAYEYIRGALDGICRDAGLKDIRQYGQQLAPLSKAIGRIDFAGIFAGKQYADSPKLKPGTLADIYALGKANIDADEVVSAVHQMVSEGFEGDGEVATDIELGRLMAVVARHLMPEIGGTACDPAAGSGNLLSCLCEAYPGLRPSQTKANDKKGILLQLLTLRLGLKFPALITPNDAPMVTACDIADLPPEYFDDISLMVMNPPMVASISCGAERKRLYDRIRQTGKAPTTEAGQPPLESAFIELANTLAKDGTATVALLPRTHLTALGPAAIALRRFLLDDFGLSLVFNFPGTGLFENVTKDTVIVAGRKGAKPAQIAMLCTMDTVADTDLRAVAKILESDVNARCGGLECLHKSRAEMEAGIRTGWATSDSLTMEIAEFASRYLDNNPGIKRLGSLRANIYRGKVGNKGLSGLLFLSPEKEPCRSMAPELAAMLSPGMRNAKADEAEVTGGDCLFLNADLLPSQAVEALVDYYINSTPRQSRQRRDYKSRATILDILHEEARNASRANSVLLPRDLRRYGRVYRCAHKLFVSTNFFVIEGLDSMNSRLLASWMTTVFFQLSCELFGKNQEGTRKMEGGELFKTHIPDMARLSADARTKIAGAWPPPAFIDLQQPEARLTDELWANALFGERGHDILCQATDLLLRKATLRNR